MTGERKEKIGTRKWRKGERNEMTMTGKDKETKTANLATEIVEIRTEKKTQEGTEESVKFPTVSGIEIEIEQGTIQTGREIGIQGVVVGMIEVKKDQEAGTKNAGIGEKETGIEIEKDQGPEKENEAGHVNESAANLEKGRGVGQEIE